MSRIRLDVKKVYTWRSPVGSIRKGCVIIKNLHRDFSYKIKDLDGKTWLAYPSELIEEISDTKTDIGKGKIND